MLRSMSRSRWRSRRRVRERAPRAPPPPPPLPRAGSSDVRTEDGVHAAARGSARAARSDRAARRRAAPAPTARAAAGRRVPPPPSGSHAAADATRKRASVAARRWPSAASDCRTASSRCSSARRQRSRSPADGRVRARPDRRPARARSARDRRSPTRRRWCRRAPPKRSGLIGDAAAADADRRAAVARSSSRARWRSRPARATTRGATRPPARSGSASFALVRLEGVPTSSPPPCSTASGQPRVRWWPVAFALQRLEDKRALPALLTLARDPQPYTRAFAVKGLGALKDRAAVPMLLPLMSGGDRAVADRGGARARPHRRSGGAPRRC